MKKIDFYSETFIVFYDELLKEGAKLLPPGTIEENSISDIDYRIWSIKHPEKDKSVMQMIMDNYSRGNSYWNDHLSLHRQKLKKAAQAKEKEPAYLAEQAKLVTVAFNFLGLHMPNGNLSMSLEEQAPWLYEQFLIKYCSSFLSKYRGLFIGFSQERPLNENRESMRNVAKNSSKNNDVKIFDVRSERKNNILNPSGEIESIVKSLYNALLNKNMPELHQLLHSDKKGKFDNVMNVFCSYAWTRDISGLNVWDIAVNSDFARCKVYFQELIIINPLNHTLFPYLAKIKSEDQYVTILELIEDCREKGIYSFYDNTRFSREEIETLIIDPLYNYSKKVLNEARFGPSLVSEKIPGLGELASLNTKLHRLYDVQLSKFTNWKITNITKIKIK